MSTDPSGVPIGELLPHGPEMTVIDRLVEYSPQRSVAIATVMKANPFFRASGVPAWVGIEYMAQTIAAHAGFEARLRGERPAIGFLLGTRAYENEADEFALGSTLTITVEPIVVEARLAAFQCSIATDHVLAKAIVNIYQPEAHELAALRGEPHA
ncbi:MAG: 3-hydroxylacyl-ACP dehydratase [Gammaproteobacteria bacterium]